MRRGNTVVESVAAFRNESGTVEPHPRSAREAAATLRHEHRCARHARGSHIQLGSALGRRILPKPPKTPTLKPNVPGWGANVSTSRANVSTPKAKVPASKAKVPTSQAKVPSSKANGLTPDTHAVHTMAKAAGREAKRAT